MSFRATADEIGLTAVGTAVAVYLGRQLYQRFKSSPKVSLVETPKHKMLVADRDAAVGRLRQQVGEVTQSRSPR